jgi:outer membrane protein OmpA-like peptidoglycan-associated protein
MYKFNNVSLNPSLLFIMRKQVFTAIAAVAISGVYASAQQPEVVVEEESLTVVEEVPCENHYYSSGSDNWFIQLGAGVNVPFFEYSDVDGSKKHHFTAAYNAGFGKWFTPYMACRLNFMGGALHWDNNDYHKMKYVSGQVDFMWDMFNALGGVDNDRVFSIVPFAGLGAAYAWDMKPAGNIAGEGTRHKSTTWAPDIAAGLQLRFRLCKYVDFFAEGRVQFLGDVFNGTAYGVPADLNISAIGGFSFNIGGREFSRYNPCDYTGYISNLNNQVNDLRAALATTGAALAAAEAQLPCPEVEVAEATVVEAAPLMATVRFSLNSARIVPQEKVNVYNIAQWMKENPEQNVAIVGYADADTGTAAYNMTLSKRRAQAVYDMLTGEYGVDSSRLSIVAEGSDKQVYEENNWNRIVIFNVAE